MIEQLADFETYTIAVSGGKDSTATALWALEHLPRERLRFVFCDTGAEWPETYDYLTYLERELEIKIDRIWNGLKPLPAGSKERQSWASEPGLFDMVRARGMWPGARFRYCTKYLKSWPLRLYAGEGDVILFGQRADESKARSTLPDFTANGDDSFHRNAIYRPVLEWSERDVWEYLRRRGILPNPMYNYAMRCGCWCCIMGKKREILAFCRLHPEIARKAADLEQEIGHTWRPRWSITNLLRQAQAQMPLFEPQPRFAEVA